MILNFIGKKKCQLVFFSLYLLEKNMIFKRILLKKPWTPHVSQHRVGGATATALGLRGQVTHSVKRLTEFPASEVLSEHHVAYF